MKVNLEQIKKDRANGVIISNITWDALLAYASELEKNRFSLEQIAASCAAAGISDPSFEKLSIDLLYGNKP